MTVLDGRTTLDVEVLALEVAVRVGRADLERTGSDPRGTVAALDVELDVAAEAFVEVVELEVEGADLGLVALGAGLGTESVNLDGPLVACCFCWCSDAQRGGDQREHSQQYCEWREPLSRFLVTCHEISPSGMIVWT